MEHGDSTTGANHRSARPEDPVCVELLQLLDCAHLEVWRSAAGGAAADWDRGFAEGVASALALLTGEDRDDLHLASVRRVRGRREIRLP
jgi:hypothetical protein